MRRRLSLIMVLAVLFTAPSAASGATVRLPTSAADWATFSPQQRTAAYAWVQADYEARLAAGTAQTTTVSTTVNVSGGTTQLVTGTVKCGFNITGIPYGTYTNGWVSTSTNVSVWWISNGLDGIWNKFIRDGDISDQWGVGRPNTTFVLGKSSPPNFKWWFESVTYTQQGWGSAQKSSTVWYFKNKFCQKQVTP